MHQVTWRAGDIAIKVRDFADRPCKRIGPRVAKEIFKPQKGYEAETMHHDKQPTTTSLQKNGDIPQNQQVSLGDIPQQVSLD